MLCQTCSAYNDDDREFCFRCQNKLLVLSGINAFEEDELEDYEEEGDLSLDEHLLDQVKERASQSLAEGIGGPRPSQQGAMNKIAHQPFGHPERPSDLALRRALLIEYCDRHDFLRSKTGWHRSVHLRHPGWRKPRPLSPVPRLAEGA
jgi:hypothetical protein